MSTQHSPKLQHYRILTIRLFSVISRTLVGGGGVLSLSRDAVDIFYSPGWLDSGFVLQVEETAPSSSTLSVSCELTVWLVMFITSTWTSRYAKNILQNFDDSSMGHYNFHFIMIKNLIVLDLRFLAKHKTAEAALSILDRYTSTFKQFYMFLKLKMYPKENV